MEPGNVLNKMAEYDFSVPIDVEMIFEDSDNDDDGDDLSFKSALSEQENINDSNIIKVRKDENKSKKDDQQSENQINNRCLNKSMLNLNNNTRALREKLSQELSKYNEKSNLINSKNAETRNEVEHYHTQNISDVNANPHALILIDDDTVNNEERLPSNSQINNHHDPVTSIEDLLNKLSEYLVLILQSFYNYVMKKNDHDDNQKVEVFHFIKSHFYELSYSIVESIFLPQEQNESFKNQFLDNTVLMANNNEDFELQCHRGDVIPFFVDLLNWTKDKKEKMKQNQSQCHSNENILLKQQLVRPLLPLNIPLSEIVAKNDIATQKKQNNLCIFSSGPPGSEISINIDANTLKQINEIQLSNSADQNVNNNDCPQSCESTRRITPVASPTSKRNRLRDIKKNNPQYDRAPPPYQTSHRIISHSPQQYDQTNVNQIRNHENSLGQPHSNHPRMGQPQPNHSSTGQPLNNHPRMGQPHHNHPSMGQPHNNHPRMEQRLNNHLSMGQPHNDHTRMEQPHHNHPSMVQLLQNQPRLAQLQNNHPSVGQLQNNHMRMRQPNHNHPSMGQPHQNHPRMGQPNQNLPSMGQPHHNYPRMGQPQNNHLNMGQSIQNYPTQVHYNINQSSPQSHNHRLNYLCNPNNNIPMHRTQIENQGNSGGATRNMPPSNAKTRMLNSRCYMCGKNTSAPYDPSKHIYCSYLCQELDSQFYKPSWGNT